MSTLIPDTNTHSPFNSMEIPHHWSAEQAMLVWEFLEALTTAVWDRYEPQLVTLIQAEIEQENNAQLDLFDPERDRPDFDDDLPDL